MFYIYFAKSQKNGKVYVGYTGKIQEKRVEEHNSGSNIWNKQNGPFNLLYYEMYSC